MKNLKFLVVVLIAAFSFGSASAQVRIKATIGHSSQHRTVVVRKPVHHHRVVVKKVVYQKYRRPVKHY